MFYTATLIACLSLLPAPTGCRTHEIVLSNPTGIPTAAWLEAQNKAAEWLMQQGLKYQSLRLDDGRGA